MHKTLCTEGVKPCVKTLYRTMHNFQVDPEPELFTFHKVLLHRPQAYLSQALSLSQFIGFSIDLVVIHRKQAA